MRNLGVYFESLAYEYTLPKAIKEGYLSPIKALTIPLKIDMSNVSVQAGDFKASEIGTALDPYLEGIAQEMQKYCMDKKTVVFLPLVKTSQKFRDLLNAYGFQAAEVNGDSQDRAEVLKDFDAGKYNVLCNSMLLTEGWDCPSVDCIVVLRPTKVRSLYCQMVGRGTRLSPETGKDHLLLLDFLWHTERHELCHPASLICENEEVAQKMTENLEREVGIAIDIEEAEKTASEDVVAQREESLAKQLAEMKKRKKKLVDPLQFEMSIQAEDLSSYVPSFGWEMGPPSDKQKQTLEKLVVQLHQEMQRFAACFSSVHPRIKINHFNTQNIQQLLLESKLLITDYSSIFFDFAYLGKPLAYYAFDEAYFFATHYQRGYFDLEENGFGPVCRNPDEVLQFIKERLADNMRVPALYRARAKGFFPPRRTDHCSRTVSAIRALL